MRHCTAWPDTIYKRCHAECCRAHDFGYSRQSKDRDIVDYKFLLCLKEKSYIINAHIMYIAVRLLGWYWWNKAKKQKEEKMILDKLPHDKALHGFYGLAIFSAMIAFGVTSLVALCVVTGIAVAKEVKDRFGDGVPDIWDIIATIAVPVGLVIIYYLKEY